MKAKVTTIEGLAKRYNGYIPRGVLCNTMAQLRPACTSGPKMCQPLPLVRKADSIEGEQIRWCANLPRCGSVFECIKLSRKLKIVPYEPVSNIPGQPLLPKRPDQALVGNRRRICWQAL